MDDPASQSTRTSTVASIGIASVLLLAVTVGYFWYTIIGPGRYLESERLRKELAALPGVTSVEVHGHEDVGYEVHGFTLEVEGLGTLKLGELTDPAADKLEKIHINRIGDRVVTYAIEGYLGAYKASTGEETRSQGWGAGFTVGTNGAHSALFPFPLHSVSDVIERYSDICAVLDTWPVQPEYDKLVDGDGVRWFYALSDPALESNWLYPAELEKPD